MPATKHVEVPVQAVIDETIRRLDPEYEHAAQPKQIEVLRTNLRERPNLALLLGIYGILVSLILGFAALISFFWGLEDRVAQKIESRFALTMREQMEKREAVIEQQIYQRVMANLPKAPERLTAVHRVKQPRVTRKDREQDLRLSALEQKDTQQDKEIQDAIRDK